MDKNIGKRLDGRYQITELIGMGGMADVYKAQDIVDDKVVAVKILKKEFADNDDFVRRFRNESKAIAVLSHPNIVKIYDVGFSDKIQFIVMEYIDGITLKEFMEQQGKLKWKDAVYFVTQILKALQHAHDRGIVHRDIKPQNVMLFPDGQIKVMDFGIAKFAREEGKTLSDKAIGSVHYISPEQASGGVTDERGDIYSVGVMLYEMLTGVKPFDADSPVAVALMHMQNNAKPPREINDAIPEGLEEIVMRAMQKDPADRYQSASEMINDIEQFKKNPSMVFGYTYSGQKEAAPSESSADEGISKTKYFDRNELNKAAHENVQSVISDENTDDDDEEERETTKKTTVKTKTSSKYKNYDDDDDEDDDDEDDEEESVSKSSYFIVTLTAIAATVLIVVVIFVAINVIPIINPDTKTDIMPNLVGVNYNDAKSTYAPYFNLTVGSREYSSEYDEGIIISQSPKAGSEFIVQNTEVTVKVSRGPQMVIVKNVYDLESNEATDMLQAQGFFVSIVLQTSDVEENHVISTEPEKNTEVEYGSTVILYVSRGPEIQDILMVDTTGMQVEDAQALLESKGLVVTVEEVDSTEDKGVVLEQSIPAADEYGDTTVVTQNTEITLTVSSGIPPATDASVTFSVPSGIEGSAGFKAYINGNVSGTTKVDNLAYVSSVTISVNGTLVQTVSIEATNSETGESAKIGEYVVDFGEGTVTEMSLNRDAFTELFTPKETETETETQTEAENVEGEETTEAEESEEEEFIDTEEEIEETVVSDEAMESAETKWWQDNS